MILDLQVAADLDEETGANHMLGRKADQPGWLRWGDGESGKVIIYDRGNISVYILAQYQAFNHTRTFSCVYKIELLCILGLL